MSEKSVRQAIYIGTGLAAVHTAFAGYSFYVVSTYGGDGEAAMLLVPLGMLDAIITLLLVNLPNGLKLPEWCVPAIYILGGGALWFLLPRLFLPKGYRRLWGRRKSQNSSGNRLPGVRPDNKTP